MESTNIIAFHGNAYTGKFTLCSPPMSYKDMQVVDNSQLTHTAG